MGTPGSHDILSPPQRKSTGGVSRHWYEGLSPITPLYGSHRSIWVTPVLSLDRHPKEWVDSPPKVEGSSKIIPPGTQGYAKFLDAGPIVPEKGSILHSV